VKHQADVRGLGKAQRRGGPGPVPGDDGDERQRQHEVDQRTDAGHEAVPPLPLDHAPVNVHRAAGQADAAEQQEHHRQHDAQRGIGVLRRIEREVAAHRHVTIAEPPGRKRVPELVQAQRYQPPRCHEGENGQLGAPSGTEARRPGHRAGSDEAGDDEEENRARQERGSHSQLPAAGTACIVSHSGTLYSFSTKVR